MDLHVAAERGVTCEHMPDVADKYAAETLGSGRKIARLICNQGFIDTTRLAWQAWMWKRRSTWPSPLWYPALFLLQNAWACGGTPVAEMRDVTGCLKLASRTNTISPKIIAVLTRYRPIVLELI